MRKSWFWLVLTAFLAVLIAAPDPETARTRLADGFDFPVGKPDAEDYYKARGFRPNGHLGEDWNGIGGGNTDLGDPVYAIGHGMVTLARDMRSGWGKSVIIRHIYLDGKDLKTVDSMYTHLDSFDVKVGQQVTRGEHIGTIGSNRGMYTAHLHFEIRKNLNIGMNRSQYSRGFENYYDPTSFITSRRETPGGKRSALIAVNTYDGKSAVGYNSGSSKPEEVSTARNDSTPTPSTTVRPSGKRKSTFRVDRFEDIDSL
ncbi:MAG: M23 family metallopeptidase [Chthoniobacterales bacterium]